MRPYQVPTKVGHDDGGGEGQLDEDADEVGQAEAEDGAVDGGGEESAGADDGGRHQRVAGQPYHEGGRVGGAGEGQRLPAHAGGGGGGGQVGVHRRCRVAIRLSSHTHTFMRSSTAGYTVGMLPSPPPQLLLLLQVFFPSLDPGLSWNPGRRRRLQPPSSPLEKRGRERASILFHKARA